MIKKPVLKMLINSCPKCGEPKQDSTVLETRPSASGCLLRRRYECRCGYRYTTYEINAADLVRLKKGTE